MNQAIIKNYIIAQMTANGDHGDVQTFFNGIPYRVPSDHFPMSMVVITNETTVQTMTGNRHVREYEGVIWFEVIQQDNWTVTDRVATVPSATLIDSLVDATISLFKTSANRSLSGLALDNGRVTEFIIGNEAAYGLTPDADRPDSMNNFGTIPFVCRSIEVF
jgi:hypothetical protein